MCTEKVVNVSIESEISAAVEALDRAPEWVQSLPIENSDRVIAWRVREALAVAYQDAVVVVDVSGGSHGSGFREMASGPPVDSNAAPADM
jgi:hypothetical protein